MSRAAFASTGASAGAAAAPRRRSATVQRYGPLAAAASASAPAPTAAAPPPAASAAGSRARRSSAPPPGARANGAAASADHTAAGDSAAAAPPLPSFPALERFLAVKGENLRQRRMQQLHMEAAVAAAAGGGGRADGALRVATAWPQPHYAPPAQAAGQPHSLPHPHPLPHQAYAPRTAHAYPFPQSLYAPPPLGWVPAAPTAESSAEAAPPMDSEPLSPASLHEMLLLPELQAHLEQLKRQWRKEWEREQRQQQIRKTTKPALSSSSSIVSDSGATGGSSGLPTGVAATHSSTRAAEDLHSEPRVHFDESTLEPEPTSASAAGEEGAAALLRAQAELLAEQQAHSATMSRLTQLTSTRMEERAAMEVEQERSAHEREQLESRLRDAEKRAEAAQRALDEERQRHAVQLSSLQANDTALLALTSKYESLLEKYTDEKMSASEAAAALRAEQARAERLEADARDQQRRLNDLREELRAAEDRLVAAQRSHREEEQLRVQQEQQWAATRQTAAAQAEADHERLRSHNQQLQIDVQRHLTHIQQLQTEVHSCEDRLREHAQQTELRLQQSEKDKQEQLRFTDSMHANLDLLSRQSDAKQQEVRTLEGELRSVLQAFEQLKAKHANKVAALQSALEARAADLDDCKLLLKTLMGEEKATRMQRDQCKQQLQQSQQQLQQCQTANARLQTENAALQSRSVSDASLDRIRSLEHELRISNEVQSRLEKEKERLAVRLEDAEEKAREAERRHADERAHHEHSLASAPTPRAADPDPDLLRSFHELSDKLAIKEKILESLTEQLANESRVASSLTAEVKALKKGQAELERSAADLDEARRAAQAELKLMQAEANEWAHIDAENAQLRTEIESKTADCERLQKQLNKKCESLSYIESEVSSMKLLFERKESESAGKLELAQSEGRAEAERARQEQRRIEAELQQRTQQYQDAQNSVHQCEQEMRMIIVQLDKERKQRVQIKQKLEGLMPQL